jgi:hypothetical protein
MLGWLYDIFVAIISFIMGLFGCEFGKKCVTFAEGTKSEEPVDDAATTTKNESTVVAEDKAAE